MQKISLLFILLFVLTPLSSATNFTFLCPSEVKINQEFKLAIDTQATETYDVKIFAYQDEFSNIISEIKKAEQWTNPFYYLKEVFPSQKEFTIRIIKAPGQRELCARLRQTGKSSFTQQCANISVLESSENSQSENKTNNPPETNSSTQSKQQEPAKTAKQTTEQPATQSPIVINNTTTPAQENEKIILNPKSSNPKQDIFTTKEEKKRLYMIYAFMILCVIIIVLLALRKL